MQNVNDPGTFSIAENTSGPATVVPQSTHQETFANLANLAVINFDFTIEFSPIFDAYVSADVALILRVFVIPDLADPQGYQQIGADYLVPALTPSHVLRGLRLPANFARVQLFNNSGGPSTVLSAQVHARSI